MAPPNYNWSPNYRSWEPFRKMIKSRSKWFEIFKRFGLNYLPQNLSFNSEITRSYYELQERDMESTENADLPRTFNEQFLWNRDFTLRWDFTRNLHMNFQSATHAEIEEPYTVINKDLYPDEYHAWKDSVWKSIRRFGTPLDYQQNFNASYQLPLNLIPAFDWVNADANYTAAYTWVRGTDLDDGTSLGNTITTNRNVNVNGTFNLERLYNHIPFLKKTNDRFNKNTPVTPRNNNRQKNKTKKLGDKKDRDSNNDKQKKELPKNKRSFEKEITIKADTAIVVSHNKKTRRLTVAGKDAAGHAIKIKWRKVDDNKIKVFNKSDSTVRMKITVTPKEPLENQKWYKTAQVIARGLMMVRNVSFSYRNQYSMSLPGFMPTVGKAFGQKRNMGALAPGLDFAFGAVDDSYIDKARDLDWLLTNDSVATPAVTNSTEDVQIRATLEPVKI